MKKSLTFISTILALVILAGCASSKEEAPKEDPMQRRDLPEWFLVPPTADETIYGLGMAKQSSDSLSRETAVARARRDIAFQVSTRVKAMLSDYAQDSGADGETQTIAMVESVSKQVADVELTNTTTEKIYPAVDGTWYALVSFPKSELLTSVENIFSRNEDAAFAEFKAQEAMRRLEADIESNPMKSEVTAD